MKRRDIGALALALPALATASALSAPTAEVAANESMAEALLPRDPLTSVRQFMRMMAATRGDACLSCEGIVYGHVPGEVAHRLVGFQSALIIRTTEISPGAFRTEQREAMHYADLETGEPLEEFTSPYTAERLKPIGYVSPLNVYFFDARGSYMQRPTNAPERGPKFDWRTDGSDIWVTESRFNTFASGITEAEFPRAYSGPERKSVDILTYRTQVDLFARPDLTSLPAEISLLSDAPWPFWLMRGREPGGVLWQGFGRKYASFDAMPARFLAATARAYPRFLEDPWGFPEWEYGTAPQMRRLRVK